MKLILLFSAIYLTSSFVRNSFVRNNKLALKSTESSELASLDNAKFVKLSSQNNIGFYRVDAKIGI